MFFVSMGLAASTLRGQSAPTEVQVSAWLDREINSSLSAFDPPLRLKHEIIVYPAVDDATLAMWRAEVEGKPEHPFRSSIALEERLRKAGSERTVSELWLIDPDHWRYTIDFERNGEYRDTAVDGQRGWQRSDARLKRMDAASRKGVFAPIFSGHFGTVQSDLDRVLHGRLVQLRESTHTRSIDVSAPGRWKVELTSPTGYRWRYQGSWDAQRDEGRVLSTEELDAGKSEAWFAMTFEDHAFKPSVGRVVAHTTHARMPRMAKTTSRLLAVERPDRALAMASIRTPEPNDPGAGDRRRVQFVENYRDGQVEAADLASGETRTLQSTAATEPTGSWLRLAGWITLAGMVGLFVYVRFRGIGQ